MTETFWLKGELPCCCSFRTRCRKAAALCAEVDPALGKDTHAACHYTGNMPSPASGPAPPASTYDGETDGR